jgi:U3 small nucleolar RNA-associated protein 12
VRVQVWCLKVSRIGDFLITGSHDRSLRRWRRSTDPFFLEEEKEKRLERAFEANIHPASRRAAVVPGAEMQAAVESAAQPSKVPFRLHNNSIASADLM